MNKISNAGFEIVRLHFQGEESHDFLHLYSDRVDKNIHHYFFNSNEFSNGKVRIPHRFL